MTSRLSWLLERARSPRRGACVAAAMLLSALLFARLDHAEEIAVPIPVQAALLAKVAAYDRNLPARAGAQVSVLILTKSGDDASAHVAQSIQNALVDQGPIVGLPHEQIVATYTDAPALARTCKGKHISIVYLAPGFTDDDLAAMAKALDGADVLTSASVPSYVSKGIVLGFDLVSGKPKLLVHLGQARRQNVALAAEILKLMKVYE